MIIVIVLLLFGKKKVVRSETQHGKKHSCALLGLLQVSDVGAGGVKPGWEENTPPPCGRGSQ